MKVAVKDTHPGQETPHLKTNLGKCWGKHHLFFSCSSAFLMDRRRRSVEDSPRGLALLLGEHEELAEELA